jgi:predicted amidohydrolase YtcJ
MAIRMGRIQFVGSERGALTYRGPQTRTYDAAGRTIIPGIADAHVHLLGLGIALLTVDLRGTRSLDEVVDRIAAKARALPPGSWITGRGWDQNDWPDTRLPTHERLSRAVPNHPVFVTRVDGHAAFANAAAVRIAEVSSSTRDPDGGRLERSTSGEPTGVFVDRAMALVSRRIPPPSRDVHLRAGGVREDKMTAADHAAVILNIVLLLLCDY